MLAETGRTMDTLIDDHLLHPPCDAKTKQIQEDRNIEVERENKILFEKIERIIHRQGPYKVQNSKKKPEKKVKVFHVPSDMGVVESTYFQRPSFDMTRIKREQRDTASRKLQNENQKVQMKF